METGRDRVTDRIRGLCQAFPDLSPDPLDESDLEPRDAALMHAIYDAAVRRWTTLEWITSVAASRDTAGLDPEIRAGLLVGSAQLLLLDRIPDHAAINESVEWVKARKGRGASGLVNAVLRRVCAARQTGGGNERHRRESWTGRRDEIPLPDGRAMALTGDFLPEDDDRRVSVATGVSLWLVKRWRQRAGFEQARRRAWGTLSAAPVIVNASLATVPVEFPLAEGGAIELTRHDQPGHYCVTGPREALIRLLGNRTDLWVQDPSSSAAVDSVRDLEPHLVVDLCAGRGTKTRQLAAAFPECRIVATDTDPRRFETLARHFDRHPRVVVVPAGRVEEVVDRSADLVLIDVPCSNTGVLSRRIEARHRAGPEQVSRLVDLQRRLVRRAAELVRGGGGILYATCSLEPEENQELVGAAEFSGFALTRERWSEPSGGPGRPPTEHRDGSYSAVLTPGRL